MPCGIGLLALVPGTAGKHDRSGRDAVDADVRRRELLRQRLGQADLGSLDRVVGHASARLAALDRRDHDDRAAAALLHVRHRQARRADRRKQRFVERRLPLRVGRCRADPTPPARPTLLTRMSRPPNASTVVLITSSMPAAVETSACTVVIMLGRLRRGLDLERRFGELLAAARADARRGNPRPRARARWRARARGSSR